MTRLFIFSVVLSLSVQGSLTAQSYDFSTDVQAYQDLSSPTVLGTSFGSSDNFSAQIPYQIGAFNVPAGDNFTVGAAPFLVSTGVTHSIALDPMINQSFQSMGSSSSISYQVDMVGGQRILKVQWKQIEFVDFPGLYLNVQLWIEEITQNITFHFGPGNTDTLTFAPGTGPQVGIFDFSPDFLTLTELLTLGGNPAAPAESASTILNLSGIPAEGTRYLFTNNTVINVGVDDRKGQNEEFVPQWDVYPNPAVDYLFVGGKELDGDSFLVTDMRGVRVAEFNSFSGVQASIPVGAWPSGVYVLTALSADGIQQHTRFVKN